MFVALLIGAVVSAGCGDSGPAPIPEGDLSLRVVALAGPTCPVQQDPPQPGCDDRPVSGAVVAVVDDAGRRLTATTDDAGEAEFMLRAGRYSVEAAPVEGLLGTPDPVEFTLESDRSMVLGYDTGIR
jgi:hypothetical protein